VTDYARLGVGYAQRRVADPRIEAQVLDALGDANTVLNVGAGTGNYEPRDREVVAVEPASTMLMQRADGGAPAVRGFAEALPFRDDAFDVAMGVLTVHHWRDRARGMTELVRVARRAVILYFEATQFASTFWLYDYWPEVRWLPSETDAPDAGFFRRFLAVDSIVTVPIPADCTDAFAGAYWARPELYLDRERTAGMSSLAQLDAATFERGAGRLRADLESGAWDAAHGHLRTEPTIDLGYRIVTGSAQGLR
jgi:SAM-dependent methyltransferase